MLFLYNFIFLGKVLKPYFCGLTIRIDLNGRFYTNSNVRGNYLHFGDSARTWTFSTCKIFQDQG